MQRGRVDLENSPTRSFDGQFLNISNPFSDERLRRWNGYSEMWDLDRDGVRVPADAPERQPVRVHGDRAAWLDAWHTEREWFEAIHRTRHSNGVIGLHEHFQHWQPESVSPAFRIADERDWPVLRHFAARRRELTESDLLILASDHWNFNVRGIRAATTGRFCEFPRIRF